MFFANSEVLPMSRVRTFGLLLSALVFVAVCIMAPSMVLADRTYTGNINPTTDPTTWTSTTGVTVGNTAAGTITVTSPGGGGGAANTTINSANLTVGMFS